MSMMGWPMRSNKSTSRCILGNGVVGSCCFSDPAIAPGLESTFDQVEERQLARASGRGWPLAEDTTTLRQRGLMVVARSKEASEDHTMTGAGSKFLRNLHVYQYDGGNAFRVGPAPRRGLLMWSLISIESGRHLISGIFTRRSSSSVTSPPVDLEGVGGCISPCTVSHAFTSQWEVHGDCSRL